MREVMEKVRRFGPTSAPVLITGESGTGKELVARSLHLQSPRASGPFVALNCAALPDTLIETELFGHERGAFTGAAASRQGRFEAAHGGTLFLDEIAEFPILAQAKILRVIETGRVERLGSNESRTIDVRIISATHQSLADRTGVGTFRLDLYYRLSILDIWLPPLRSRPDDLEPLIQHVTAQLGHTVNITPAARRVLEDHSFPGNVRELGHVLFRGAVLSGSGTIDVEHLPVELVQSDPSASNPAARPDSLAEATRQFERQHLVQVLEQTGGHRTRAAKALGISRKCLWEKMRLHELDFPRLASFG
jgi:DNA-binding NtrC family response regulator